MIKGLDSSPKADKTWLIEGISRAPYRIYTDPDIYLLEQANIFRGNAWHYLGINAEVPETGDYKTTYIGETTVLMVRAEDGSINGMVNRYTHRGNMVCWDAFGKAESLYCVYHAWNYDLKGNLKNAAFSRGIFGEGGLSKDFDKANHGLTQLRIEVICGLVFATFSETVDTPCFKTTVFWAFGSICVIFKQLKTRFYYTTFKQDCVQNCVKRSK